MDRVVGDAIRRFEDRSGRLPAPWLVLPVVAALAAELLAAWRVLARPGRPPLKDSIVLEYVGWRMAHGAIPYVDVWEVKPPLAYEVPAVLALAAPDVATYHLLAVALTGSAAVATVGLLAALTRRLTGDPTAAALAGLAPLVHPAFHLRAAYGFKPKYLVLVCGLLAIYLALSDRPTGAGAAGAAAAGLWQGGAAFWLLAAGVAVRRQGREALGRAVLGGAAVTAVVVLPVLLGGGLLAMVTEVVLVGLAVPEGGTVTGRLFRMGWSFQWGLPVAVVGLAGLLAAGREPGRRWVFAAGALFLVQVLALDYDTHPDLFPLLAVLAVGVGLVAARAGPRARTGLAVLVVTGAAVGVVGMGSAGVVFQPHTVAEPTDPVPPGEITPPYSGREVRTLYWEGLEPETCHVFVSRTHSRWFDLTGRDVDDPCGRPPPMSVLGG